MIKKTLFALALVLQLAGTVSVASAHIPTPVCLPCDNSTGN